MEIILLVIWSLIFFLNTKASSLNGEANGLDILLDVEQFNYAFRQANAAGFRISLHGHNVKPGGFQLELVSISRVINEMTCYNLSALIC